LNLRPPGPEPDFSDFGRCRREQWGGRGVESAIYKYRLRRSRSQDCLPPSVPTQILATGKKRRTIGIRSIRAVGRYGGTQLPPARLHQDGRTGPSNLGLHERAPAGTSRVAERAHYGFAFLSSEISLSSFSMSAAASRFGAVRLQTSIEALPLLSMYRA